jgi:aspartate/methionine/tyrosine aminotransferase
VVTNGITHGVSTTADMWTDPSDVVVVPEMMWGNYNMIFRVKHGARFATYPMFDNRGGFDLAGFGAAINAAAQGESKIMVILNFPHNPSGYSVSEHEGREIVRILAQKAESGVNVIAVCDDAYFGLFYETQTLKESLFAQLSDRHERLLAVKLDGATKENYVWGLRVGFITYGTKLAAEATPFYEALEKKTAGCIRGTISNASHIGQSIVLKSMQDPQYQAQKAVKFEIMRRRAERVKAVVADPKYASAWEPYPFNSGYFMCLRLKTVAAEPLRVHLLDKYGVGLISLGEFDLRVAFSCLEAEEVADLFDTILKGVEDLQA